jgi:hypothetical protein
MNPVVSLLHLSGITGLPEVQHEPVLLAIPSERHYRRSPGLWAIRIWSAYICCKRCSTIKPGRTDAALMQSEWEIKPAVYLIMKFSTESNIFLEIAYNRLDIVRYLKIRPKAGHLAGWPALAIFNLDCIFFRKSDCQRI